MALSHEILWREKRENSPIPFGPDFINLENWNLPPPFLGKLFKSLSLALPLSSIHQSIWLAGFGTPPSRRHLFRFCPLFRRRSYDCVRVMLPAAVSLFAPSKAAHIERCHLAVFPLPSSSSLSLSTISIQFRAHLQISRVYMRFRGPTRTTRRLGPCSNPSHAKTPLLFIHPLKTGVCFLAKLWHAQFSTPHTGANERVAVPGPSDLAFHSMASGKGEREFGRVCCS